MYALGLAARWLHLASAILLVGAATMIVLAGRSDRPTARRWEHRVLAGSRGLALMALGSGLAVLAVQTALFEGRAGAALEAGAIARVLIETQAGRVWLVRFGLLVILAALLWSRLSVERALDCGLRVRPGDAREPARRANRVSILPRGVELGTTVVIRTPQHPVRLQTCPIDTEVGIGVRKSLRRLHEGERPARRSDRCPVDRRSVGMLPAGDVETIRTQTAQGLTGGEHRKKRESADDLRETAHDERLFSREGGREE